jgi:hypothetical protein
MTDLVVWRIERGPQVRIRAGSDGRARIVIDDGGRQVSLRPDHAAQIASGIDLALTKIDRSGRLLQGGK